MAHITHLMSSSLNQLFQLRFKNGFHKLNKIQKGPLGSGIFGQTPTRNHDQLPVMLTDYKEVREFV